MKQRLSLWMMSLLFGILPMTAANVTSDPSVLEFGKMWMEGGCIAKLTQRLCIEVKNIGDKDYYGVWLAVDEDQQASVKISGHPFSGMREFTEIQVAAASTDTIEIYICAPRAGKYKILCANVDPQQLLFDYEMDIADYQAPKVSGSLKLDMLEQTNESNVLYCDTNFPRISGTISITNEGENTLIPSNNPYFTAPVYLESDLQPTLPNQDPGIVYIDKSIIKPGETITRTFDLYLAEKPEEGKEYYVEVGILQKAVASVSFTVRQCTNTYWAADGTAKSLPLASGSLKIPAEALAVDLRGQHHTNAIYSVDVSEANPNCLYYLGFLDNVPQGFISEANIIRGDEAKTLVVNADYDYFCPMPFKAREAMFYYTPYSESTGPAEPYCSWTYSGFIFFPFDVQKAWSNLVNDSQETTDFYGDYFKTSRLVHAYTQLVFSSKPYENKLSAFTPYLITDIIPASLTFYAEDVTIPSTNAQMVGKCDYFAYIGSTFETVTPKDAYMWSNDKSGFFLCEEGTKVRPFTPVVVQREPLGLEFCENDGGTFIVGNHLKHFIYQSELPDSIGPSPEPTVPPTDIKSLRSEKPQANEGGLSVYSLSGQRVTTVESVDGRIEGLKSGLYIIGGKKVVVR